MKKLVFLTAVIFIFSNGYCQDDPDRTGFNGEVTSQLKNVINEQAGTENESVEETTFIFNSKTITINDETYELVNKEFDGIDINTFLCTKRGSNYTITYIVDDYISVVDNSNPNIVTYYHELTESQ